MPQPTIYRSNVLGVILNNKNQVLILERHDAPGHWQFPQGGVEASEDEKTALLREIKEETGIENAEIIKKLDTNYKYDWPEHIRADYHYKYAGQEQSIYLLRFNGGAIDLTKAEHKEFREYKWVEISELIENLHPVRRGVGEKVVDEISKEQKF